MNHLMYVIIACFWGGSFVAIKVVVESYPPIIGAALRVAVALASLGLFFAVLGKPLGLPRELRWKAWLTGAFAQAIPFSLLFWGERHVSPGVAGIGNGTVPIWTFLLGALFLGAQEAVSARKIAGLAFGVLGMAIISLPLIEFNGGREELLGTLAVFGMALSYAVAAVLNRRLLAGKRPIDFHANLFQQHAASLVLLALEAWLLGAELRLAPLFASKPLALSILYLGLCSTAIAWILFYHLIKEWGAFRATSVTYAVPVTALLFDFIFFGNLPSPREAMGALAILSGVIMIQWPAGAGKAAYSASTPQIAPVERFILAEQALIERAVVIQTPEALLEEPPVNLVIGEAGRLGEADSPFQVFLDLPELLLPADEPAQAEPAVDRLASILGAALGPLPELPPGLPVALGRGQGQQAQGLAAHEVHLVLAHVREPEGPGI